MNNPDDPFTLNLTQRLELERYRRYLEATTNPVQLRKEAIALAELRYRERNAFKVFSAEVSPDLEPLRRSLDCSESLSPEPEGSPEPEVPQGCQATCEACGVKIESNPAGDIVHFSYGKPGTRSRLFQRVCRYARRPGCINLDTTKIGEERPGDRYDLPPGFSE